MDNHWVEYIGEWLDYRRKVPNIRGKHNVDIKKLKIQVLMDYRKYF